MARFSVLSFLMFCPFLSLYFGPYKAGILKSHQSFSFFRFITKPLQPSPTPNEILIYKGKIACGHCSVKEIEIAEYFLHRFYCPMF